MCSNQITTDVLKVTNISFSALPQTSLVQLTCIFDQKEQQTTPTCDRVGRFWGWLGFCSFQKGFPHARTQFSGRRVGVPTPTFCALAASLVIEKFPLQLRQLLILLAKKGSSLCPTHSHLNLVSYEKAGDNIFYHIDTRK